MFTGWYFRSFVRGKRTRRKRPCSSITARICTSGTTRSIRKPCAWRLAELDAEEDNLQFAMTAYGLCVLLEAHSETEKADALRQKLLVRDGFWFCFSYLNN